MAQNTTVPQRIVGGNTAAISATAGAARQLMADTEKQTVVLMDGVTPGGHPMVPEVRKVVAGTPNVKINGGTEGDLSGDITINVLPGAIPGVIELVTDPEGQPAGKYLKFNYTNDQGEAAFYLVNMSDLIDTYTAGNGIVLVGNQIRVNPKTLPPVILKPAGGLEGDAQGLISVKLEDIVDTGTDSLLKIENGKITLKSVVSADADNILQPGSDKLAYMPGDLGTL